ncbi:MAG: endonuclease/exonuclease/phosphatase family protein, partial [Planctomycetota bacterium]
NGRRNHDEIRLWLDYIDGADWIVDDAGVAGGLAPDAPFIVMGDLNADPADGDSRGNPAGSLLDHPRVNGAFTPTSVVTGASRRRGAWDVSDTAVWGLRVEYAQPSTDLTVTDGGVIRGSADLPGGGLEGGFGASDHFPVWVEIALEKQE